MPIQYKINVLDELKKVGYSTYKLRKDKILSESTLQKFRDGELVSFDVVAKLCQLLNCQPGDILLYVPDDSEK